jgi:hypothetical protein
VTLAGIHAGDLVEVDVHGWRFFAVVDEVLVGELRIDAGRVNRGRATWRRVSARQVVGHWSKRRVQRPADTVVSSPLEFAGATS